MKSIVGTKEWEAACEAYIAQQNAAAANGWKGWEHANCDHGSGYCAETVTNTFGG